MKSATILSFVFLLFSCQQIDKEKLVVINEIQLGIPIKDYYNELTVKGISKENFYTKVIVSSYQDLYVVPNYYYTRVFNFPAFVNSSEYGKVEHLGILYPTTFFDTDNIIGINVLLGHTPNSQLISINEGVVDISSKTKTRAFCQDVNSNLMNKLIKLFNEKYGDPISITKDDKISFYSIEKNGIKKFSPPIDNIGEVILWETKYLKIRIFKGIKSYKVKYRPSINTYTYSIHSQEDVLVPDSSLGEVQCYSFPFINYEVKEEVIKKLGLNKRRI